MLALNDRYRLVSNSASVEPTFTIAVHFDDDGTDVVYFTSHGEMGRPTGAGVQYVDHCVTRVSGATQKIDPQNSTSSIGSINWELVDVNGNVSALFAQKQAENKSPRHRKVEIYYGYRNYDVPLSYTDLNGDEIQGPLIDRESLDWLDYQRKFTMIFSRYTVSATKYKCYAEDIQRIENKDIFTAQGSTLVDTITAEQMFIPIAEFAQTTKFQTIAHDASYSDRPNETVGYARINNEVIAHSGVTTHPTFGVSLQVLERGALNTRAVGHKVDENAGDDRKTKIQEFIYLEGPALKLLYAIQTGVLYGQGDARLPDHWQMGIYESFVRLSDYLTADPLLWEPVANVGRKLRFEGIKKTNGEEFIRKEILSWLVGIRPVYADGAIGFKKLNSVLSLSSYVFELNDTNIVNFGELDYRLPDVINQIEVDWDYSFLREIFLQGSVVSDIDSEIKYKEGKTKRIQFLGVKSSNQTLQDMRNIFNGFRNRYAGGGYKLSVEVMPSVNFLEVGDLIRLRHTPLPDPLTNAPLDRVFEVQQITPNTRTGRSRLSLFASTEAAGEFELITASTVLNDSFYTSQGTPVSSVLTMSGNTITANGALAGGNNMAQGIYYHDDDLILPAGVTLTITRNVQLRVRGQLVRNGDIVGDGHGHPGGNAGTLFASGFATISPFAPFENLLASNSPLLATNETAGLRGYMGNSQASNFSLCTGFNGSIFSGFVHQSPVIQGSNASADRLPLINRDGDSIENIGLLDLRGTSGAGSRPLLYKQGINYHIASAGANGGASGAGLIIICRGESVGASSVIRLNGDDGGTAARYDVGDGPRVPVGSFVSNGGGGGGYPGAYYLLIDGNGTFGSSAQNVEQTIGLSGLDASASTLIDNFNDQYSNRWTYLEEINFPVNFGRGLYQPPRDLGENGFKVQFIPAPRGVGGGAIEPPRYQLQPIQGGVTLTSGTDTLLGAADGAIRERVRIGFTLSNEAQATSYEVQARESSQTIAAYRTIAIVTTNEAFFDVTENISYHVRIRVLSDDVNVDPSEWVESSPHVAQGKSQPPSLPTGFHVEKIEDGTVQLTIDNHPDSDFLEYEFIVGSVFSSALRIYRGNSTSFNFGAQRAGFYRFWAIAYDRSLNASSPITIDLTIEPPTQPAVLDVSVQADTGLLFVMNEHPDVDFREYVISYGRSFERSIEIFRGNSTRFLWDVVPAGNYNFYLVAVNRAFDVSEPRVEQIEIIGPDISEIVVSYEGENAVLSFISTDGTFAIRDYRISYLGSTILQRSSRYTKRVDWLGGRIFTVELYDIVGNSSREYNAVISPILPGRVMVEQTVVDNIIEFRYQVERGSLPIDHYDLYRGDDFTTAEKFSEKSGTGKFTTKFEPLAGRFTFHFVAVDSAGNEGPPGSVVAHITQLPDYELFDTLSERDLGFDGDKTNCIVNSDGSLIFPVDTQQSLNDYAQNGFLTLQDEVDAGYGLFIEPLASTASYIKNYDLGITLDSTIINVAIGNPLIIHDGNLQVNYVVGISDDNVNFTDYNNELSIFAENVRYIRLTVSMVKVDPGLVLARYYDFQLRLSLKTTGDDGLNDVFANDSGGTFIEFNKNFLDIKSIVVSAQEGAGGGRREITWDFQDVPNPTGFLAILRDDQGNRVNGRVSWQVTGYIRGDNNA